MATIPPMTDMALKKKQQASGIHQVLKVLRKNRTLIKMTSPENAFECLTIIADFLYGKHRDYFIIDNPEGYPHSESKVDEQKVHFEFTNVDKQHFAFESVLQESSGGDLRVRFPDNIHRIQRRRNFRIQVPGDTTIRLNHEEGTLVRKVVDVSLGGTLIVISYVGEKNPEDRVFNRGDQLENLILRFSFDGQITEVQIHKARIVRLAQEPSKVRRHCALQFAEIAPEEERKLTEVIYKIQRHFLRARLKVDV